MALGSNVRPTANATKYSSVEARTRKSSDHRTSVPIAPSEILEEESPANMNKLEPTGFKSKHLLVEEAARANQRIKQL